MKIVSIINYKGGVGKTTITANLASEMTSRGKRVLIIDLDPQTQLIEKVIENVIGSKLRFDALLNTNL